MSDFILEAENVTKVLGRGAAQVHALKDVNLSLRGGELTVLMGPSGSGKTTLLSVLGCMLAPTSGTVRVCGHATEGADAEAREAPAGSCRLRFPVVSSVSDAYGRGEYPVGA